MVTKVLYFTLGGAIVTYFVLVAILYVWVYLDTRSLDCLPPLWPPANKTERYGLTPRQFQLLELTFIASRIVVLMGFALVLHELLVPLT